MPRGKVWGLGGGQGLGQPQHKNNGAANLNLHFAAQDAPISRRGGGRDKD